MASRAACAVMAGRAIVSIKAYLSTSSSAIHITPLSDRRVYRCIDEGQGRALEVGGWRLEVGVWSLAYAVRYFHLSHGNLPDPRDNETIAGIRGYGYLEWGF